MAVDIHKLIASINPDLFCDDTIDPSTNKSPKDEVKKIVEEEKKNGNKHPYLKAADKAKLKVGEFFDLETADISIGSFDLEGIKNPVEQHSLIYDTFGESLEPIYFWILDNLRGKVTKLVDNFAATPTSSAFGEIGIRVTKMQEEAMKMLGSANTLIKSALNIIYDLKEFKIRLDMYKEYHSQDTAKKNASLLSLKQLWLDQVDIKRGNTSIKAMAQQFDYVTLIDAFMASSSSTQLNKKEGEEGYIDLNERVRRLLLQRYGEFERWLTESESELTKRYDIEKNYLKSQMASLKLYARWAKPYLKAAHDLEFTEKQGEASLVTAFNTMILELALLVEDDYDPSSEILRGDMPLAFKKLIEQKKLEKYKTIMIVEFKFRSSPERMSQGGYGFRGRVEVLFTSYALSDSELKTLKEEINEDDIGDAYKLIEEATGDSIASIEKDIKDFLEDKEAKEEGEKKEVAGEDTNPFSSLFSIFKTEKSSGKESGKSWFNLARGYKDYNEVLRSRALIEARRGCRKFYDIYKKAHSMPAFPGS